MFYKRVFNFIAPKISKPRTLEEAIEALDTLQKSLHNITNGLQQEFTAIERVSQKPAIKSIKIGDKFEVDENGHATIKDAKIISSKVMGTIIPQTNSEIDGSYLTGVIASERLSDQASSFNTNITFYATAYNVVAWTAGSIKLANGKSYTIPAGNTGALSEAVDENGYTILTYIYFDSSDAKIHITTDYSVTVASSIILLCIAKPAPSAYAQYQEAFFIPAVGILGINSDALSPNLILTTHISDNAISSPKIQANAIQTAHLAAGSVVTAKLAAGAVTTDILAANAVTTGKLAAGAVTTDILAANAVTTGKLAAGAVTTDILAANAVTTGKLAAGAVTADKIAAAAIDTTKLNIRVILLVGDTWTNNSPSTGSVAWNAHSLYWNGLVYNITAGNTANKYIYWINGATSYSASATFPSLSSSDFLIAVNNDGIVDFAWNKIAAQSIATPLIANSAIDEQKLADSAVTLTKYASGLRPVQIVDSLPDLPNSDYPQGAVIFLTTENQLYRSTGTAWEKSVAATDITGQITTTQITDEAISTPKLAANAVTAAKIAAGTITSNEIAANTIVGGNIAAGAIGTAQLSAGAITADKLAVLDPFVKAGTFSNNSPSAGYVAWSGVQIVKDGTVYSPADGNTANEVIWWDKSANVVKGSNHGSSGTAGTFENEWNGAEDVLLGLNSDGTFQRLWTGTAIIGGQIYTDAITTRHLSANSVTTDKLAAGAVTTDILAANAVTAAKIAAGTITSNEIAANTIVAGNIAAGAIGTAQLAAGAVTTDILAANAVTTAKIAAGAVTTSQLNFTPLISAGGTGAIVATINASTEGITIASNKISISGSTTFSAGYDPSTKVEKVGGNYMSATSGAAVKIFPDANTGIQVLDDLGNNVFLAIVGGTDVGDVTIGNYAGGQGIKYDKSANTTDFKGNISAGTISGVQINGATISGGSITIGGNFSVNSSGVLTATGATIKTAGSGARVEIAGSHIDFYDIYNSYATFNYFGGGMVCSSSFESSGNIIADGVLSSHVSTGTAPIIVYSTTLCTNLNADLLDGYHASAFQPAGNYCRWRGYGASDPTTGNQEGDMFFNTTTGYLEVYANGAWHSTAG